MWSPGSGSASAPPEAVQEPELQIKRRARQARRGGGCDHLATAPPRSCSNGQDGKDQTKRDDSDHFLFLACSACSAFDLKRVQESYSFASSSFLLFFFDFLSALVSLVSLEAAFFSAFSALSAFFSGSAFSLFSTSSRIDMGALSPTRFSTWMIRVYPPGRSLNRGPMVSNSLASAA